MMEQLFFLELIDDSIINPSIRIWPGTPNNPMPTLKEAYEEGRERGLTWPKEKKGWEHIPGGPFVSFARHDRDPLWAQARHSQMVYREWMRGWHQGFREQCGAVFPSWYRITFSLFVSESYK